MISNCSLTRWKVLAEGQACTLLDVHILTGQTHQIRVHMRSIQHPVCGDELYGFEKGVKVPCLMLHAYSLKFNHPRTKEEMTFQAPLPEDFLKGLKSNGIDRETGGRFSVSFLLTEKGDLDKIYHKKR